MLIPPVLQHLNELTGLILKCLKAASSLAALQLDPEKKRQESERCYAIPREQGAFVHLEERGIEVSDTPDVLHRIVENHLNYQELYAKKSAKEAVYKAGMAHVQEL